MDSIDRLKLAIYESGLSEEDRETLLNYVESREEEPFDGRTVASLAATGVVAGGSGTWASAKLKIRRLYKRKETKEKELSELSNKLIDEDDLRKRKEINSRIDKVQSEIKDIDEEVKKLQSKAKKGLIAAGVGVGAESLRTLLANDGII